MEQLFFRDGTPAEPEGFTKKGKPLALNTCRRCGGEGLFGPDHIFAGKCFECEGLGKSMVRIRTAKENAAMDRANDRRRAKKIAQQKTDAEIRKIKKMRHDVRRGFWAIEELHAKAERPNNWIGETGERRDFTGTVRFIASGEGNWGNWFLTVIDTDQGAVLWWNAFADVSKGDAIKFKATIKDHTERDGEKQTVVNRAKAAA